MNESTKLEQLHDAAIEAVTDLAAYAGSVEEKLESNKKRCDAWGAKQVAAVRHLEAELDDWKNCAKSLQKERDDLQAVYTKAISNTVDAARAVWPGQIVEKKDTTAFQLAEENQLYRTANIKLAGERQQAIIERDEWQTLAKKMTIERDNVQAMHKMACSDAARAALIEENTNQKALIKEQRSRIEELH